VAPFVAGKNAFINGGFDFWQRGTTFSTAGVYTSDRWKMDFGGTGAAATVTQQTFTPNAAPVSGYQAAYFYQVVTTSGSDTGSFITFEQNIEDPRTFAGQTITVSFWAKAASGTPKVGLEVIQQSGGSGSSVFGINSTTRTISTSWARYSFTFLVPELIWTSAQMSAPNGAGKLTMNFWLSNGSTLATRSGNPGLQSNTFQFWGFQAEVGNVASPFQTASGSIGGELALCQRYYKRWSASSAGLRVPGFGGALNTTSAYITLDTNFRTVPNSLDYSNIQVYDGVTVTTITSATLNADSTALGTVIGCGVASGLTSTRGYQIVGSANTGYIGIGAEL
jgi:hypothetical protein